MYTFHCDSIVHLFQVSLFRLWNSRSYKSPLLPTISRVVQAQHRKGVVTNSQQRFTPQLCPLGSFQKRPNKPCLLSRGGTNVSLSELQNRGLSVTLNKCHAPLRVKSALTATSCQYLGYICPFQKKTHPDRIACSCAWAQWCGLGRMGRDPVSWEGIGSVPDYPLRRGNLSWRDQLNRGVKKSIWNNLTLDILVKASRKLLELTGAFLHFCFN